MNAKYCDLAVKAGVPFCVVRAMIPCNHGVMHAACRGFCSNAGSLTDRSLAMPDADATLQTDTTSTEHYQSITKSNHSIERPGLLEWSADSVSRGLVAVSFNLSAPPRATLLPWVHILSLPTS